MNYPRYPKYKDSGVEWLGEIPEGWIKSSVRYLFSIGRGRVISQEELIDDGLYPVYSSQTLNDGCLGYIETYDYDCSQITWTTDGANAGTVFIREGKHNCTNVCGTLEPRSKNIQLGFYYYLLSVGTEFYKRPDTNGAKIMNNEMAAIAIVVPSISTQQAIATFLDTATVKIDELINDYEELIGLLQEKRQTLISHAVTRGLSELVSPDDPDFGEWAKPVTFKDSGIEWIGEIPEGWEVPKVGYHYEVQLGKMLDASQISGESLYPYIRNVDVQWREINTNDLPLMDFNESDKKKFSLRQGDILVCEGGDVGRAAVWDGLVQECFYQKALHRLRPYSTAQSFPNFFLYFLEFANRNGIFTADVEKTTIFHLPAEKLRAFFYPLPSRDEQEAISKYLDYQTLKLGFLIDETESAISLLKEHRSALITNAVTGKINVEGISRTPARRPERQNP
jgi:type I restriction enzyme S subunit